MDGELIEQIARTYVRVRGENHAPGQTLQTIFLLVECVNDCVPLDLPMFALATDRAVCAEIDGMWENFDRTCGKLALESDTGYWPRYALEHRCSTPGCTH